MTNLLTAYILLLKFVVPWLLCNGIVPSADRKGLIYNEAWYQRGALLSWLPLKIESSRILKSTSWHSDCTIWILLRDKVSSTCNQGLFGALLGLFGVAYLTHKNPKMISTVTIITPMPNQNSPRTFNLSRAISRRANAPSGGSHAAWMMMSCRICLQLANFPTLSLLCRRGNSSDMDHCIGLICWYHDGRLSRCRVTPPARVISPNTIPAINAAR